ncbi:MAG TPA: hypothetical protein VIS57_02245, partial [Xanthomonadales bacterium]
NPPMAHYCPFASLLVALCLFCVSGGALAQTQIGADIDGEAAYDQSGTAVALSLDGSRMAIGAPENDGGGINAGHVRVYRWSGTTWTQLGGDINGEAAYDGSGSSLALSADGVRLAIGAPYNDDAGFDAGHVRVYRWSGSAWTQLGSDIDGEAAYDESGHSVALSDDGNRLAIGAIKNDGNGFDAGHVRVYQWSGSGWTQLGGDINGEMFGDESGWSVALSSTGKYLAVGARKNDGNGIDSGHVRVYQWSGSAWTRLGTDINGEAFGDESGASVSLSADGRRLAIGAHKNDGAGIDSGQARVYQWSGVAWTQLGADINGASFGDNFGWSLSLSADGNRLAIGAINNDATGIDAGQARVYQWSNAAWTQIGADINGAAYGDKFGWAVALSANGNRAGIGAPLNINNSGVDAGQVRAFDLSGFNTFSFNAGLNDAWYYPVTDGQGFFINVFPEQGRVSLAWFTYDTELPPPDAVANLGDPGHRWLTALGPIAGNVAVMNIEMTSGGLFDTATEITRTDPPGSDGTIILTFYDCNSGVIEYDIPSIKRQGIVPIQRVAIDNVALCEALTGD